MMVLNIQGNANSFLYCFIRTKHILLLNHHLCYTSVTTCFFFSNKESANKSDESNFLSQNGAATKEMRKIVLYDAFKSRNSYNL